MPRVNNLAITRQFPGGRNESEKITIFVQLEEGDKPGDTFKEVHSIMMDLDPFGPWSEEDVSHAASVVAHGSDSGMSLGDAKRILADHDEWKRARNAAVDRLNQMTGATMDTNRKPPAPEGTVKPPLVPQA